MRHNFELLMKDLWQALEHPGKDRLSDWKSKHR